MAGHTRIFACSLLLALSAGACEQPRAHGDVNAIIVGADPAVWDEVSDAFLDAMEPTIQTVRNERPFRVTHQDPEETQFWGNLRRFRQVLVLGVPDDPWIADALSQVRGEEIGAPPAIFQVQNVWARGQLVSVILLPPENRREAVAQLAPVLRETLDAQFRDYALNRMFVSGRNAQLTETLSTTAGFSLVLPQVYRHSTTDSIYVFRNDNPSPADLIREIVVTWVSPIPDEDPTREELESWRESFSAEHYSNAQLLDTTIVSYQDIEVGDAAGVEFQSAWVSAPDAWPAGGPFITRALRCPAQDRLYLMDAWLYAPNRDKYEYMIQLETILDSFRCG